MAAFIPSLPLSTTSCTSSPFISAPRPSARYDRHCKTVSRRRCVTVACVEHPTPPPNRSELLVDAAMMGDVAMVTKLLSSTPTPDLTFVTDAGLSALMWACIEGHASIFESLLAAGASSIDNSKLLLLAFEHMPSLNPRPAPPPGFPGSSGARDPPPQIPIAVRKSGHAEIATILLRKGADWRSARSEVGESLMHIAARRAQTPLLKELAARGADINDRGNYAKESPLYIAAKENHTSVVQLLCALGADIEAANVFEWTSVVIAAACGNVEALQVLVRNGAEVRMKVADGKGSGGTTTALKEGRKSVNPVEVSKLLARAGAVE